jgi:hypothetical protein
MNEIQVIFNIPSIVLITITLLSIGACFFLIGYLLGKRSVEGVSNSVNRPTSFFDSGKQSENKVAKIKIDDAKYVTEIKTDGMEKKYDQLGDVKQSAENITNSINKLKNLKR